MATLISIVTGNFTAAGTWGLCDSTAALDSEAANTALTTSYVGASTFTPGAITIDAIAVKVAVRSGTTGTMSVELYNSTGAASVVGTEVTINCSDIASGDTAANGGAGWYVFKFAAPVLLLAATNYAVRAKTSSAGQVNLFSSGTSNWSRQLRTTTTQAPAAGDVLIVAGDFTAAATFSSYTVTMNNTTTDIFGLTTVNNKGTFAYGVTAATNYYFKLAGNLFVYAGGILNIGTSGSPIPADSTAVLEFASASSAQYGLVLPKGGTVVTFGNLYSYAFTTLNADASAGATSMTSTDSTGWKNGDVICLASTTRTASQAEIKALTADAVGTALTITALTSAHGGNAATGVRGHIGNLTRNVKIRGINTTTGTCYVWFKNLSNFDCNWTQFNNIGDTGGAGYKRGITITTTTANYLRGCTIYDCYQGISFTDGAYANVTISDLIVWNATNSCMDCAASSGSGNSITRGMFVKSQYSLVLADYSWSLSNIVSNGMTITAPYGGLVCQGSSGETFGTWDTIECYGNTGTGLNISFVAGIGTISNVKSWRNNLYGFSLNITTTQPTVPDNLYINGLTMFGNASGGVYLNTANGGGKIRFNNVTSNAGLTLTQPNAVDCAGGSIINNTFFTNCSFGATQSHTTADLIGNSVSGLLSFQNCLFSSTTEIASQSSISSAYRFKGIGSTKHDQTAGNAKRWMRYGTAITDTTIFNTASPSERITPTSASYKVESGSKFVSVASGATCTITVNTRRSSVGDGTAYNGNQPRLMLRANSAMGIEVDTVIDTHTAANGSWEALTGASASVSSDGVLEFYVDCDGTTGWINVDDWSTTSSNSGNGVKYWGDGIPYLGNDGGGAVGGGSYTFS